MGSAEQYQYPGVDVVVRDASGRAEQGTVSRELLDEKQAVGGKGPRRSDVCLGDSGGAAPQGGRGRYGECPASAGRRGACGGVGVQGGKRRSRGWRLHRASRSAVSNARRHVLQRAELSSGEST